MQKRDPFLNLTKCFFWLNLTELKAQHCHKIKLKINPRKGKVATLKYILKYLECAETYFFASTYSFKWVAKEVN